MVSDDEDNRIMYYPAVGTEWVQMVTGTIIEVMDIHVELGLVDVRYEPSEGKLKSETLTIGEFIEWFERK